MKPSIGAVWNTAGMIVTQASVILRPLAHLISLHVSQLLWACCVSDSPDMEASQEHGLNLLSWLFCVLKRPLEVCFGQHSHWKEVKTGSLEKVPSYICLVSRRSPFSFHPSFFCIAVAIRLERLGIVFSISRQLERVTGCLAIGPAGRHRWFNSHVTPSAWQSRQGASGEGFTHRHWTYTYTYRCIHSHACMCGELSHTFFSFTLSALTRHSRPETLKQSAAAD